MKHIRFPLAAFASLALLSACAMAPEEKLAEAEASFAANDYSQAKVYLVSALRDVPSDAATLTLLARTQIAMGDGEGALASLDQIPAAEQFDRHQIIRAEAEVLRGNFDHALGLIETPKTPDAARIAALAQLGKQDGDAAKTSIDAGLKLDGSKAALLAVRAQIELAEGNLEAALETSKRAMKDDPKDIGALLASARANQAAYDLPETLKAYDTASKLYPQNFAAQLGRVATLAEMGRADDARDGLAQLDQLAPKSLDVIHMRARLALEDGEYQAAREMLQGHEAALRENPSQAATYATVLLRVGQVSQARVWLEPLVEDFPYLREPRSLLAEAELAAGDPRRALATIRPLAERPDARPEELQVAANAAKAAGDPSAARFAGRTQAATPEWIGGELAKGDTALRNQQWAKAAESYEAIAARTAKPNAMVLNNLAYAKSKLGKENEAIKIALEAVEIAPDHPAVLDTAGWILVESGQDRARGIKMLEQAAKLDPDNAGIARRLASAKRG